MAYGIYDTTTSSVIAEFVSPMTVRSNQPMFISDTLSLKRSAYRRSAQRWEIETNLSPVSFGAQDLMINLLTNGYNTKLKILTPQNYGAKQAKTYSGTLKVTSTTTANVNTVSFSYDANSVGKIIPKGTFIKFSGHDKVYMTTSNLVVPSSVS